MCCQGSVTYHCSTTCRAVSAAAAGALARWSVLVRRCSLIRVAPRYTPVVRARAPLLRLCKHQQAGPCYACCKHARAGTCSCVLVRVCSSAAGSAVEWQAGPHKCLAGGAPQAPQPPRPSTLACHRCAAHRIQPAMCPTSASPHAQRAAPYCPTSRTRRQSPRYSHSRLPSIRLRCKLASLCRSPPCCASAVDPAPFCPSPRPGEQLRSRHV